MSEQPLSAEELAALAVDYQGEAVPPCGVCGANRIFVENGPNGIRFWACSAADATASRRTTEGRHYKAGRFHQMPGETGLKGDPRIPRLVAWTRELEAENRLLRGEGALNWQSVWLVAAERCAQLEKEIEELVERLPEGELMRFAENALTTDFLTAIYSDPTSTEDQILDWTRKAEKAQEPPNAS